MTAERGATSILVRVVCLNPPVDAANAPPGIFGLQDKDNILTEGVMRDDGALTFSCTLQAKPGDPPNFLGPYAHGTPGARFLYLSLRPDTGGPTEWIKRIKVPLDGITWHQIEAATLPGKLLQASIDGQQAATVPILGGWQVVSAGK